MPCANVNSRIEAKIFLLAAPWTTDADFEAITVYFQPPSEEEGFNVVHHKRA
jgi:hypothetical protein